LRERVDSTTFHLWYGSSRVTGVCAISVECRHQALIHALSFGEIGQGVPEHEPAFRRDRREAELGHPRAPPPSSWPDSFGHHYFTYRTAPLSAEVAIAA
ncbi:hypothetical protein, partial [Nocardia cyriacigeorgica]|uniref:hypothetical protein n=1 Tax=Nocardia cyriacigeorgica TaxID=135487 RepID=UPI0024574199